ncbi:FGGY-family carbohydrate kinase [Embleya sp. NPDC005971]|uniref:FGGY-family carbohydrate kinase n=1 Tax=Embleya sp. NPDC005971 TaxID=3156724 RepID=UPI0033F10C73
MPGSPAVVVGVDVGSNSVRALALDPDGAVLGAATAGYPGAATWEPGRADPYAWFAATAQALAELRALVPGAARPAALCLGGQSPTTVPDAVPRPGTASALTCRHPAGATGSPVEQHHAQHDALRAEHGSDVRAWQLYDWLAARFGAERAQARWPGDPPLTGYGPIVPTGSVLGTVGTGHDIAAGTPLVAGAQDAYLAFWAGGLDRPGRAMDPGGRTGGLAVAVAAGSPAADAYALPSAVPGIDIVGGPVAAHGLILEWLRDLTGRDVRDLLGLAAHVPPGARGVMVLPYLEGERAPRWNRELRGEVFGLSAGAGPGELARAVLEGAAYGLAHIALELSARGARPTTLVCAGSPARSPLWCSIKAAVLGVPVEVPAETDLAAYGAALAAGAGAGWWPVPGAGRAGDWPRPAMTVFEPEPHPEYATGLRRFLELGDAAQARVSVPAGAGVAARAEATPAAATPAEPVCAEPIRSEPIRSEEPTCPIR